MRILMVCQYDWAGAVYGLMEAVNEHTEHLARAVTFHTTPLGYQYDMLDPSWVDLWRLLEWAEVLNLYDGVPSALPDEILSKKTVVRSYLGSEYRRNWQHFNRRDAERGWPQTCTTIDLSSHGPTWLGQPMAAIADEHEPSSEFIVCHAPINEASRARKGTAMVLEALDGLMGVKLDVIENLTHAECMKRKAKASVLVDQVGPHAQGYGRNGLEAWALGMPVVSDAPDEVCRALGQQTGRLPFYHAGTAEEIRMAVRELYERPDRYAEWRSKGREFFQQWHAPAKVADRFVQMCEEAMLEPRSSPVALGQHKPCTVLPKVYSHPRSGTAFLGATLKKCFFQNIDTTGDGGHVGHWANRVSTSGTPYGKLIGDHSFWGGQKGIYIYRDGHDVAVSLWRTKTLQNPDNYLLSFTEFLHKPLSWRGLPSQPDNSDLTIAGHWSEHLDSWHGRPGVLMVRFEDLIIRPAEVLQAIGDHLGLVPDGLEPERALVGLEPHEGQIGTWREFFTKDDLEFFYSQVQPEDHWGFYTQ